MSLTNQVRKKLDEYGIQIFNHYKIEGDGDYVYYADSMIVFVNEEERSISITFQATTKPERSAALALILNQIKRTEIHIMSPFIFNEKNEFISGEAAYELIKRVDQSKLLSQYHKEQVYADMLANAKCHEC